MNEKERKDVKPGEELIPADDFMVVELDDRLEFGAAILETDLSPNTDVGCNGKTCKVNVLSCGSQ